MLWLEMWLVPAVISQSMDEFNILEENTVTIFSCILSKYVIHLKHLLQMIFVRSFLIILPINQHSYLTGKKRNGPIFYYKFLNESIFSNVPLKNTDPRIYDLFKWWGFEFPSIRTGFARVDVNYWRSIITFNAWVLCTRVFCCAQLESGWHSQNAEVDCLVIQLYY